MARDWATTYAANIVANTHTIPFTSPAVAGRKLVAVAVAPAGITFPAGWTEQVTSSNKGELTVGTLPAAGGESQVVLTLTPAGATRCLAGWVESRDDLGSLDGAPVQAAVSTIGATSLTVGSVTTSQANSRIYVAVVQVGSTGATFNAWSPAFPSYLTAEPVQVSTGGGNEPLRMVVASGVAATPGAYSIAVTGLPSLPSGHAYQGIAFAFAPPAPPAPAAETAIEAENRLAGTAKSVWDVTGAGDPSIQGFAAAMSVAQGGTLSVKVHSPSAPWTGKVYRLGYYGGAGAREVATITGAQTTQPSGTTDPTTGMVSCANWTANGSWVVPADATPGVYIVKVARNDNAALASHIGPFVVRNPARKAPIVVKTSDSTWQAYNHAGANPADPFAGANLYGVGTASSFVFNTGARCKAISYDRPLVTRQFLPQTSFFNAEYPLVRWVERLGYDVDYVTSVDVDADASLLLGREVVASSGHDEYWSPRVRAAFVAARDAGVHLAFLSGNEAFWRIEPTSPGGRSYACWKDSLGGSLNASGVYSGTWQDTRSFNPDRRPAALLDGQRFRLNGQSAYELGANAAYSTSPFWRDTTVAQLTGAQTWMSPDHIVGFEADEPADTSTTEKPTGLIRLSEIQHPVTGMLSDDNGADYTGSGTYTHAMTVYQATSGAVVFGAGTVQYAWALDDTHDRHPGGILVSAPLQQALTNLLADLGAVPPAWPFPAGLVRPTPVALTAYGFPDTADPTDPTAPTGLAGIPAQTSVALTWTAATDNVGVTGYRIYRGGVQVAQVGPVAAYTAVGLTGGTSYEWRVSALDAAGNESAQSAPLVLATTAPPITLDPAEPVGMVRLLITDTNEAFPLFTDAQLAALLAVEGGNVKRGAAAALETIATSETLVTKKISTQDLSTDGPAVATSLMTRAKVLREQADREAGPTADPNDYGFDFVDFPTAGTNPGAGWSWP